MRVSRIIDNFKNKPNAKPRAQKHEPNQSQDRCQRFLSQPQQEQGGTPLLPWIKKEDCPSSGYQSKAIQPGPGLQSQAVAFGSQQLTEAGERRNPMYTSIKI